MNFHCHLQKKSSAYCGLNFDATDLLRLLLCVLLVELDQQVGQEQLVRAEHDVRELLLLIQLRGCCCEVPGG